MYRDTDATGTPSYTAVYAYVPTYLLQGPCCCRNQDGIFVPCSV